MAWVTLYLTSEVMCMLAGPKQVKQVGEGGGVIKSNNVHFTETFLFSISFKTLSGC